MDRRDDFAAITRTMRSKTWPNTPVLTIDQVGEAISNPAEQGRGWNNVFVQNAMALIFEFSRKILYMRALRGAHISNF